MSGPAPTPTALRLLRGNPSGRPINVNEPRPDPIATDAPAPSYLSESAARIWSEVLSSCPVGLITVADVSGLARYCEVLFDYRTLRTDIERNGRTEERFTIKGTSRGFFTRAAVTQLDKLLPELRALEASLGLTPASRSKVSLVSTNEPKNNDISRLFMDRRES